MPHTEILKAILAEAVDIPLNDFAKTDRLMRRAEMALRRTFGPASPYLTGLSRVSFIENQTPGIYWDQATIWERGWDQFRNLISTAIEELALPPDTHAPAAVLPDVDERVFIVHGHDEAMKLTVARTLEKLRLRPVILHEQPNMGRTIIEKFTDYSAVGFAVVLLSPDDTAFPVGSSFTAGRPRARQNVILELGYFLGRLGRNRVAVLFKEAPGFELPSDYSGVVFLPFDGPGRWSIDLVKELRAAGYDVDANDLL